MPKFILKNKIVSLSIIIVIALFAVFFLNSNTTQKEISPPPNPIGKTSRVNMGNSYVATILEINEQRYESIITEKISVYDFMKKLQDEEKIKFTEKNYIGMGKFIDKINGVGGNGERNWIYYVNGKEAKIGVSNYKINPGDIVSWKYEKYE